MDQLKAFFEEVSSQVEARLDLFIPAASAEPARLHEAIRWSLFAGGKRFRPALMIAAGKIFGADPASFYSSAAAIEMIHTYSLIHDDLPPMDNDDMRRGLPTCHRKFDEATAILAGDLLQTLAFQIIAEDGSLPAEMRIRVISELAKAAGSPEGMIAGQQLDLDGEGKAVTASGLEKIHQAKTGAMIRASAKIGAIIGGAGEHEINLISNYAAKLGLLFQITDDLLDITQSSETLGKTAGKDLKAQKATYPGIYGIEEARKMAEKTHAEAIGYISGIEGEKEILIALANFILRRQS